MPKKLVEFFLPVYTNTCGWCGKTEISWDWWDYCCDHCKSRGEDEKQWQQDYENNIKLINDRLQSIENMLRLLIKNNDIISDDKS